MEKTEDKVIRGTYVNYFTTNNWIKNNLTGNCLISFFIWTLNLTIEQQEAINNLWKKYLND